MLFRSVKGAYLKSRSVSSAVLGRIRVPLGDGRVVRRPVCRGRRGGGLRVAARFRFRRSEQLRRRFRCAATTGANPVARHVACAGIVGMAVETASPAMRSSGGGRLVRPGQMQVSFFPFRRSGLPGLRPEAPPAPYLAVHRPCGRSIVSRRGTMA